MLLTVETSTSTSSRKDSSDSNAMRPAMTTNADRRNPGKGKNNTMNTSSSRGLYRRLNRHREKNPFEFDLPRATSEESD